MVPVWLDKSSLTKERWKKWDGFMENIPIVNNLGYNRRPSLLGHMCREKGCFTSPSFLHKAPSRHTTYSSNLHHFWQSFSCLYFLMSVTFIISHVYNLVIFLNTNQCQMSRNSLLVFQWSTCLQKIPCALGFLYGLMFIFGLWFIVLQAFVS